MIRAEGTKYFQGGERDQHSQIYLFEVGILGVKKCV